VGIMPERFAAQHVRLTPWSVIDSLHADEPAALENLSVVDARHLRIGPLVRTTTVTRNGQSQNRGESTQQLARITRAGRELLVSTRTFVTPAGPAIDSSYADAVTLTPVRHVGLHDSRTMVLDFAGHRVTGRYAEKGKQPLPIDQVLEAPPFDSSLYDLVIAALPLAEGYTARLPFYIYEQGGLVSWDVKVVKREAPALADGSSPESWQVEVSEGGEVRTRLWVPVNGEREVLRSTFYLPGGEVTSSR
jgi:hypothetical protein